jgi:hypothetical protein
MRRVTLSLRMASRNLAGRERAGEGYSATSGLYRSASWALVAVFEELKRKG